MQKGIITQIGVFICYSKYRISLLLPILVLSALGASAQIKIISIGNLYRQAQVNYPQSAQKMLIDSAARFSLKSLSKGYLPTLSINAQASYQSAVTSLPFTVPLPGLVIPSLGRDQYKGVGEISQILYDGGQITSAKNSIRSSAAVQQQELKVNLYQLYDRIDQLFFGVLILKAQISQQRLLEKDIAAALDQAKALVASGVAYRSTADEFSARLIEAIQEENAMSALKRGYLLRLSDFAGEPLTESDSLLVPVSPEIPLSFHRPEEQLFNFRISALSDQKQVLNAQLHPRASLFFQGGYGRPGLNMLSNNFSTYYITGIRLSWNLATLYSYRAQRALIDNQHASIQLDRETFLFNLRQNSLQQQADLGKYPELLVQDGSLILLRQSIRDADAARFKEGVLTGHDYIKSIDALAQAKLARLIHQLQFLQSQYNYSQTIGNIGRQIQSP